MVKVLCEEAIRLGVPFLSNTTGVQILYRGSGAERECVGLLAVERGSDENPLGFAVILCDRLVLATGGPGEMAPWAWPLKRASKWPT